MSSYKDKFPREIKFGVAANHLGYDSYAAYLSMLEENVDNWAEDGDLIATYKLVRVERAVPLVRVFEEVA